MVKFIHVLMVYFIIGLFFIIGLSCYLLIILLFTIIILAESFRVPFDIPEAESELVAGFITEYSSILFSLILLTEYTNIIFIIYFILIMIHTYNLLCLGYIYIIAIIRSTFNRILYDEMMSIC